MPKIIAELCQNHRGDRALLGEMIHAAAENGASYAKIQSIWAKNLTKRERFEEGKIAPDGRVLVIKRPHNKEYERLKTLELSLEDHRWFIEQCRKHNIIPMTTIFSVGDIETIAALPWPQQVIKVPSYDCASYPMLRKLKKHFETLFVSTGATLDQEIAEAANVLADRNFVFFHCVTIYPTPLNQCHLARIQFLRQFSSQVGWSDHTLVAKDGIKAAMAASALGADHIERHFTTLTSDQTKDGPVSITPKLLKELAEFSKLPLADQLKTAQQSIPEFDQMIGCSQRELSQEEFLNRDYYRGRFATHRNGQPVYNWEEHV